MADIDEKDSSAGTPNSEGSGTLATPGASAGALAPTSDVGATAATAATAQESPEAASMAGAPEKQYALVFMEIDNLLLNNYYRKLQAYTKIGWDEQSATNYILDKANWNRIASFNTSTVSFSASSRRNRFYEVYDSDEMLALDVPYDHAVDTFNKCRDRFHVLVLTKREEAVKDQTFQLMEHYGFNLEGVEVFFKRQYENPHKFRTNMMAQAQERYQTGIAVSHIPQDARLIARFNFSALMFTSTHDYADFQNVQAVCQDWNQIAQVLDSVA